MAFSNIESSETLQIIDIAIVDNEAFNSNEIFKESFKELSDKNSDNYMYNIKYTTKDECKYLLSNDKIVGYIELFDDKERITVSSSGTEETVLRLTVDEINSNKKMYEKLFENELKNSESTEIDYQKIYENINKSINESDIVLKNTTNKNISYTMIEYYTLIAMACLYGGLISMYITNKKLPNMDSVGKRTSVSKTSKSTMIFGSLLASYVVQIIGMTILILYTIFILDVDYGKNLPLLILLVATGSLASLSYGVALSTLFKTSENVKTGILIATTMLWCTLSGMTGMVLKYVIDKNVPIINLINPASMITDALYSLYYYNTLNRYYFDVISLVVFSVIMILLSLNGLRRQKYDSI